MHSTEDQQDWQLFEVFVRAKRGLAHQHVGSLRAPDNISALQYAKDLYTRRQEGESIWVVLSNLLTVSDPKNKEEMFAAAQDKKYRHPSFYTIPEEVKNL